MESISVDTPHGPVPVTVYGEGSDGVVLLAHGAGAGQVHPWMVGLASRLAHRDVATATFDYAYTAQGRKAPDRLPKLLDVHEAVANTCMERFAAVALAGKSMGGRVGGHLVAERGFGAAALVYLGYPLVALGKTEPRSTEHLEGVTCPQLFVSGSRDRMGPLDLIAQVAASVPNGTLVEAENGDHSLVPLKSSGRTMEDALDAAADTVVAFLVEQDVGVV